MTTITVGHDTIREGDWCKFQTKDTTFTAKYLQYCKETSTMTVTDGTKEYNVDTTKVVSLALIREKAK